MFQVDEKKRCSPRDFNLIENVRSSMLQSLADKPGGSQPQRCPVHMIDKLFGQVLFEKGLGNFLSLKNLLKIVVVAKINVLSFHGAKD
jgi:hypothetical protein